MNLYADPEVSAAAKAVSKLANNMSSDKEDLNELANLLTGDHRTLQQGIMRNLVMPMLRNWAEDFKSGRYDARNEGTVRAAAVMVKALDDEPAVGYFPFI